MKTWRRKTYPADEYLNSFFHAMAALDGNNLVVTVTDTDNTITIQDWNLVEG